MANIRMQHFFIVLCFMIPCGLTAVLADTSVIIDKQNEYNGCTVEVLYEKKDMLRYNINWVRSLHYFDHRWELRQSVDFYSEGEQIKNLGTAKRVLFFDENGKEERMLIYNKKDEMIEEIKFGSSPKELVD